MTPIAPLITDFLRNYLPVERGYSPHTCDSYAYAFRLLFLFAAERLGSRPSQLHLEHLDASLIVAFLTHFEVDRGGSPASRNVRLAAVKAFMRYIEFRHPAALDQARQILAIPSKRHAQPLVRHLTMPCSISASPQLCACPNVTAQLADLSLRGTASLRVQGKGRRERCLPLWKQTVGDLRAWLAVRGENPAPELFLNATDKPMSRAGFVYDAAGYQATRDIRKVALWLGHADVRTTEVYLRVDPTEKLEAVEAVLPPQLRRGRFKAPDALIASLLAPE